MDVNKNGGTTRFAGLAAAAAFILMLLASVGVHASDADWALFKHRFLQAEGRVLDNGNNNVSHSEGQGVTMLLAVHYGDRATFDKVWHWTREHLQVRDDKLLAWRWSAGDGAKDRNNATDGDLLVAWALLRAQRRWQEPAYLASAHEIIRNIREKLLRKTSRGIVMLPGIEGFDKPEGLEINLSYWIFPALREIAEADPVPEWRELQQTGINLLLEGHFGRWGLPADWLMLGDKLKPAPPARFSYDAVRIPLYLLWAKRETEALLSPFKNYWAYFSGAQFIPAWTNLNDDSIDSYDASPGMRGIARMTLAYPALDTLHPPPLDNSQDYYSAILSLLTQLALEERDK